MNTSTLETALKAAAEAYLEGSERARELPLDIVEIALITMRAGLAPRAFTTQPCESRLRRTRAIRCELAADTLDGILAELEPRRKAQLKTAIDRELAVLKRRARTKDPRYDLNRHAALARLANVLGGKTPQTEIETNTSSRSPNEKERPDRSARSHESSRKIPPRLRQADPSSDQ